MEQLILGESTKGEFVADQIHVSIKGGPIVVGGEQMLKVCMGIVGSVMVKVALQEAQEVVGRGALAQAAKGGLAEVDGHIRTVVQCSMCTMKRAQIGTLGE